ncbi:hypothetical protein BH09PAT1_BH09PAT1_3580 [soil metagenome]
MKKLLVILLTIIAVGTILPLFHSGLFPMHDDTQVARVLTMTKALHDGMFPVRWVDLLGYNYGYPIFNFYAPFAYYVGGTVALFGLSSLISTKIMMGLGMILAGLTMYLLATSLFNKKAGFIVAIFYLYAPYHAVDLYVRGAIGELWAYALLPLPVWGLWRLYQTKKFRYGVVVSVSFVAIIISHNLTAFIITPFLLSVAIIFILKSGWRSFHSYLFLGVLILGGIISSFYSIPAILESNYTNLSSILGGGSNPLDHFVCLSQLWQSQWGFGGSVPGCVDGLSFMLGKLHIIIGFFGIFSSIYFYKKKDKVVFYTIAIVTTTFIISVLMTMSPSQFLWQSIPFMKYIQFPWRFLVVSAFSLSLLCGATIFTLEKIQRRLSDLAVIIVVIACLFLYSKYFNPQSFNTHSKQYSDPLVISYNISKISDEYMPKDFKKPSSQDEVPTQLVQVTQGLIRDVKIVEKTQTKKISLISSNATIRVNIASYPAWRITLDHRVITPVISHGVYFISLAAGPHEIDINYVQTPIEKIADFRSIIGFCVIFLGIIKARRAQLL